MQRRGTDAEGTCGFSVDPPGDGIDQNCDGVDGTDEDRDGFASTATGGEDCDDAVGSAFPGGTEVPYDGIDNDCSEGDEVDVDDDGFASILVGGDDCDDEDLLQNPAVTEIPLNGVDDDCSGEDIVVQGDSPQVDILWVIDNSGSMAEEQQELASNFPEFIRFFLDSGLDWHIGVISTDTDGADKGKLQGAGGYRYLDPDTPNPNELFQQMATLGTDGSSDERGRRAAYSALTDPLVSGYNAGFYRENASLHVIVISDENDSSGANPSRNEFINFLNGIKLDPDAVTFSSIVGPANGCATADPGTEYLAVTDAVGGIVESICVSDWAPVLEQLGLQASGLEREFPLSEVPVEDTLIVWVEDSGYVYDGINVDDLTNGVTQADLCSSGACFTYEFRPRRNSIAMLDFVPSPLAQVHVAYEIASP
jgi:hypothetical protein